MPEVTKIVELLNQHDYITGTALATKVVAALNTEPVAGAFLFGKAGTGKSFLPQVLAKAMGVDAVFYQCFPGTREDDLLVKLLPNEDTKAGIAANDGPVVQAAKMSQTQKVFLILDEWDKTRPSADSFLLDFLQHGRIWSYSGESVSANMENLVVWITMNDERDLSEPLLRRLPKIDFKPMHPALIKAALERTHAGHPHLMNAVLLYIRCLMAELPKPATIQELRQLLDAISVLKGKADWNMLVYTFVTKTVENHTLLKSKEKAKIDFAKFVDDPENMKISTEGFEGSADFGVSMKMSSTFMPGMAKIIGIDSSIQCDLEGTNLVGEFGVIKHTMEAYNALSKITPKPHAKASKLLPEGTAELTKKGTIVIHKPFHLGDTREEWFSSLWGLEGEVVLVDQNASIESMALLRDKGLIITKLSSSEVVGKFHGGIDVRWSPDNGLTVVTHLTSGDEFRSVFKEVTEQSFQRKYLRDNGYSYINNGGKAPTGVALSSISWDKYTSKMVSTISGDDYNVPGLKAFCKEFNPKISKDGDWKTYRTDGILIAFHGDNREYFGLRILDTFDPSILKHLREMMPNEDIPLHLEESIEIDPAYLIEYGFKEGKKEFSMKDSDTVLKYNPEKKELSIMTTLPKDWTDKQFMAAVETTRKHVANFFERYRD